MQIDKLRGDQLDELFDAILSLKNREECYRFFDDIATITEIQSLTQRLQVAKMLDEGRTYNAIASETKASTTTISRVKRCLDYGNEGYRIVLDRLNDKEETDK
ncbi:TrpR-related protein YerC/YecD [Gracilibacillus halotolerans]|uniref:TrpR-related protein YerC/YecD n=1 Tax=Gracilibacillus halotolerans TaxID=74386 RepID=A0A841RQH0_9BACI|nr:YerC/YecD family TrpR-related protein [Gracilibacillus halotolerans]MBB6514092.1 TrpR-related protein YerC/YecD [Gracilibacillus halotolerans]